jgi:hypothetical protein
MAFPVSLAVYDIGPTDPVSGAIADPMGHRIARQAEAVIEVHPNGWKGTFLTYLPLDLGGIYRVETAEGAKGQITVTAASQSETAFEGMGTCPFPWG